MLDLPKKYNHKEAEKKWQEYWLENDIFKWDQSAKREDTFVIDTPPPTVSGLLHMGHIFSYTQADFVARYQRMKGKTVFYPMGFDDNGLPTERLVEKVKKVRAGMMPREEFIDLCKEVVVEAEEEFRHLFKSVALSVDWEQEYQTISENSRKISQMSFLDLLEKEESYRTLQPTLWDATDRTALAQADIEDKEMPSVMSNITFRFEDGGEAIIATTRPELIPACVSVFCHPEDERYAQHVGKTVVTALFGVKVPLLADENVDIDKGTGLVMCCTFGDITDIQWWKDHKLPTRVILDKAGKICDLDGMGREDWPVVDIDKAQIYADQLTGLKVKEARAQIFEWLVQEQVLGKQVEITHAVKCAERSGSPLEILVTPQWFIKILDHKEDLLKRSDECNWYPKHMKIRLDQWIEGLSWDWCISRQRYFGVPFPVWYSKRAGEEGKVLTAHIDDLPVDPLVDLPRGYSADEVEADHDVMDTWATSSVSPQLSSHAISDKFAINNERHKQLFPADLRPQAHEIIRSWAFYTMVKAHLHSDQVPWKNLMISGWCLAADKTKMSKSKGNVVTPVAMIEEKGSDIVRYWASTSNLGSDTAYSEDVLKIGKKLITKLWNATKFAAIHLEKMDGEPDVAKVTEITDKWILSKLKLAIKKAEQEFDKHEYCRARVAIEDFFWNDFCDNYLELVKGRAYAESDEITTEMQQSSIHSLYFCLETILRLFSPFVPHITEELYSHIFVAEHNKIKSIQARNTWPDQKLYPEDGTAIQAGAACVSILNIVRKLKADNNVSLKWPIDSIIIEPLEGMSENVINLFIADLANVTNAKEIKIATASGESVVTDCNQFKLEVKLSAESDAA